MALASHRPNYLSVFLTFARNSLVREMTFRANFLVECVTSLVWVGMNLGFYALIFDVTKQLGSNTGWQQWEFVVFLATTMIINSIVQAFFMPNCEEISELIRTGGLDFALLKPIDTQFLVSMQKIEWAALVNFLGGLLLLGLAMWNLTHREVNPVPFGIAPLALYIVLCLCGVALLYSLMIALASTSIWLGRNQSLYEFWFYITNFSRYPMEIYDGRVGRLLRHSFTYVIPILLVVNVPARILARPLYPQSPLDIGLSIVAIVATIISFWASRAFFSAAVARYRSASS